MSQNDSVEVDETIDVREIDGEPFGDIMGAVQSLGADETLLLINSFEPQPLYSVLEQKGFEHETVQVDSGEWHVLIRSA